MSAPDRVGAAEDELLDVPPGLLRSVRRDPDHAAERFVLYAADHLAEPSWEFAQAHLRRNPDASPAELSEPVYREAVKVARIDGAVSGTPFFIALVPAYVAVLWEQVRMTMRIAALHGHDPREPGFAAELLVLRGVRASREEAQAAIERARATKVPKKGTHRGLRAWYELGHRMMVVAGFLDRPDPDAPPTPRWRQVLGFAVGGALWAMTWIFPLTFMLMMAFSCVSSTNALADRALVQYGTAEGKVSLRKRDPATRRRTRILRVVAIAISLGLPLVMLGLATKHRETGVDWYTALGAIVGLALILALAASRARRDRRVVAT